ncbi:MAG: hypothetical protein R3E96_15390 [Planctomycetota bacterium]
MANTPGFTQFDVGYPGTELNGGIYVFDLELGDWACNPTPPAGVQAGQLSAIGSATLADHNLRLHAHHLPGGAPVIFLAGQPHPAMAFGTHSSLCLGGPQGINRLGTLGATTQAGEAFHELDFASSGHASIWAAGMPWSFQAWYREPGQAAELTNAVEVTWLP